MVKAAHHTKMPIPLRQEVPCWEELWRWAWALEIKGSKNHKGLGGGGVLGNRGEEQELPQPKALLSAM